MSKLSIYTASFPCEFPLISDYLLSSKLFKIIKKRNDFIEVLFNFEKIIEEPYIDINGNESLLKKLIQKKIFFRIYNKENNNFVIFNQPRSILELKNNLSKIFNFDFFLKKTEINIEKIILKNINSITFVNKIEIINALYINDIFGKHVIYTQNKDSKVLDNLKKIINSNKYIVSKIELYFKNFENNKILITSDSTFICKEITEDMFLNFIFNIINN